MRHEKIVITEPGVISCEITLSCHSNDGMCQMMINGNPSVLASAAGIDVSTWSIPEMFPSVMLNKANIGIP